MLKNFIKKLIFPRANKLRLVFNNLRGRMISDRALKNKYIYNNFFDESVLIYNSSNNKSKN